jgi:demethylmenaquinone methyltransferase/2-methoxy-6-polyprenyl-1,4-benzoquinol methylase
MIGREGGGKTSDDECNRLPIPAHLVILPVAQPPLPSPDDLSRIDLRDVLRDPSRKQAFVTPMFEHIAPRYDAFTRAFSFGMDAGWKRELVHWLSAGQPAPRSVLDVACGTGDLALAAAQHLPAAQVLGIDAATGMIERARPRAGGDPRIQFQTGDLAATGLPDNSRDAVLAGYAFRNVPRLDAALEEMARVLVPGGLLLTLDFYRPPNAVWRWLFITWLRAAGSIVGWWWHRAPVLYAYIADSIDLWMTGAEFEQALRRAGFDVVRSHAFLGGGIQLHEARRRAT